jgi:hypothetical protein
MKVTFSKRDFTALTVQPKSTFEIQRYSHTAFGGPKSATIEATGSLEHLFELINHLRAPVEIVNDFGDVVWWGYVSEVLINLPTASYGVDLTTMYNRVAVAYTDQGIRYTTDWSEDEYSVAAYGKKELLLSLSDAFDTGAAQYQAIQLANSRYPIPVLKFSGGKESTATLTCQGWYGTLEWTYYANPIGKESYEETGKGGREIGEDDRPLLAQSFRIGSSTAWGAKSIWIRAWKQGVSDPVDNLVISLKANNGGIPGSTLASGQVAGINISTSAEWYEFVLNTTITLQPATTYWIHVARSGAVNPSAYFMVDTNLDFGYPRGKIFLYNTNIGAWSEDIYGRWGDLLFIVMGSLSTTDQIATIIDNCGQFFADAIIENESGIQSNPYRAGDTSGLYELNKLLEAGTYNDRRLLCEVTKDRYLRVYEEASRPGNINDCYALNKEGQLLTPALTPIEPSLCPVGIWCRLYNVIPPSVDLSLVTDHNLFFIEEAEFDVKSGQYSILATRDQVNAMDIGGITEG